jgi:MerR family transcriptional regulator, Zn(II)-responsive regulator of zntA
MTTKPLGPRDVARVTGVSTDTLRHYERQGLLPAVTRTHSGYRRYSPATIQRVLLIQRALVVGFSLAELKRVFNVRDKGGAPCRSVRALVGERLGELNRRIDQLVALRQDLRALLVEWDGKLANTPQGQRAHLLDSLAGQPGIERSRRERQVPSRRAYPSTAHTRRPRP